MSTRLNILLQKTAMLQVDLQEQKKELKRIRETEERIARELFDINQKLDLLENREFLADSIKQRIETLEAFHQQATGIK